MMACLDDYVTLLGAPETTVPGTLARALIERDVLMVN
jgi:hypothetical protein